MTINVLLGLDACARVVPVMEECLSKYIPQVFPIVFFNETVDAGKVRFGRHASPAGCRGLGTYINCACNHYCFRLWWRYERVARILQVCVIRAADVATATYVLYTSLNLP